MESSRAFGDCNLHQLPPIHKSLWEPLYHHRVCLSQRCHALRVSQVCWNRVSRFAWIPTISSFQNSKVLHFPRFLHFRIWRCLALHVSNIFRVQRCLALRDLSMFRTLRVSSFACFKHFQNFMVSDFACFFRFQNCKVSDFPCFQLFQEWTVLNRVIHQTFDVCIIDDS